MSIHQSSWKKKTLPLLLFVLILFSFVVYKQSNISLAAYTPSFLRHFIRRASNRTHYPKEAFVTFTDSRSNYVQLLDVLLDSVHLFSTRPIIVFSVDFDLIVNHTRHPRVLVERISRLDCGPTIEGCKLLAMVSSEVHYGVQLEIDSVVSYHIDLLFDMLHVWPYDLPLAPKHPDDARNYRDYMEQHEVKYRSVPYMHGTYAWTRRAYPFLRSILGLMQYGLFSNANIDETAMNVMLWKAKANHTLCKYDPYGPEFVDKYEQPQSTPKCLPHCDGVYLIFHGQKESATSRDILQRVTKLGPHHPFVQTPHGLKWLNDTNVTCCHPSATRPSPLHPLLCEYHQYDPI